MTSKNWTSIYEIMRDLSVVQGSGVPADINKRVGSFSRPPTPDLIEEENHHNLATVDSENLAAPDLRLIKTMLDIVRDKDISSDNESLCELQISKKSDANKVIKHNASSPSVSRTKEKTNKRNVALTSILQLNSQAEPQPLKLLKPNDLLSTDVEKSVEKVIRGFDTQSSNVDKSNKKNNALLEASNMFRKKTSVKRANDSTPQTCNVKQMTNGNYKPSEYADELYNALKEKQRLKAMVQEDIWSRAERQMKEIEEKRKVEATTSCSDLDPTTSQNKSVDLVKLPQHRHLISGDCVVCEIMEKHNFDIDIEEPIDIDVFSGSLKNVSGKMN